MRCYARAFYFVGRTLGSGGKQVTRLGRVHRASKSAMSPLFYPTHCKNRELFKLPVFLFGQLGVLVPVNLILCGAEFEVLRACFLL